MNIRPKAAIRWLLLAVAVSMAAPVAAQDGPVAPYAPPADIASLAGNIVADGSTNTGPITQAAAEDFTRLAPKVRISVDQAGTGGGFARFCRGETQIQNASRPMAPAEIEACAAGGIEYLQFTVALDGVTLVVNPLLDITCLTVEQAKHLWEAGSDVHAFSDLDPALPDWPLSFYGPAPDSGTFQYFAEQVIGKDGDLRQDYQPSEDYNVLVNGVAYDQSGTGIIGYAYYDQNRDDLRALAIDPGTGCVAPSRSSIEDGSYAPLSRPLFIYVSKDALARPEVREFARFYLANAAELAPEVGYIAVPAETAAADVEMLNQAVGGA
ncbi:MAG: PstS family phosphate ABC transporter substrate-binding protein [Thermomicrobiales bacterium]